MIDSVNDDSAYISAIYDSEYILPATPDRKPFKQSLATLPAKIKRIKKVKFNAELNTTNEFVRADSRIFGKEAPHTKPEQSLSSIKRIKKVKFNEELNTTNEFVRADHEWSRMFGKEAPHTKPEQSLSSSLSYAFAKLYSLFNYLDESKTD